MLSKTRSAAASVPCMFRVGAASRVGFPLVDTTAARSHTVSRPLRCTGVRMRRDYACTVPYENGTRSFASVANIPNPVGPCGPTVQERRPHFDKILIANRYVLCVCYLLRKHLRRAEVKLLVVSFARRRSSGYGPSQCSARRTQTHYT